MKKLPKINLSILKDLVNELEKLSDGLSEIDISSQESYRQIIIELSKTAGIAVTLAQESSYIVKDLSTLIEGIQAPPTLHADHSKFFIKKPIKGESNKN